MIPNFKNIHLKFKLNGYSYNFNGLKDIAYSYIKEGETYQREIGNFLLDWLDDNHEIELQTSGSTGKPKKINTKKQAMVNSAIATGDFFNLKPGNKVLHGLPSNYIAGKMMLIRAIILGLELDTIQPTVNPKIDSAKVYDFCAFTPMQLKNVVKTIDNIKTVIVGGGQVSKAITDAVQDINTNIYETYGMTETVTHIALKKLNHFEVNKNAHSSYFKTLPNIILSTDYRDCLVIDAPNLSKEKIITNDVVTLYSETSFDWLGRYDNVINSGGIKLFPEEIERKLNNKLDQRFFIASKPDDTLGQKVILVLEGNNNNLDSQIFECLDTYEKPKEIFNIPIFKETKSGKIQRKNTINLLNL
ncbi:MAG: AMP-binding protein [Flaviramulus sp.]|nr:AMP-binding protein [Flaviramulus sp.]